MGEDSCFLAICLFGATGYLWQFSVRLEEVHFLFLGGFYEKTTNLKNCRNQHFDQLIFYFLFA